MTEPEFTTSELANEIWKPIPGFEEYYSASNIGRIRRDRRATGTRAGLILKGKLSYDGYRDVTLYIQGNPHYFHVHQLIARTFIGPCPEGHSVNHKDSRLGPALMKLNNRTSNLEYRTHQGQMDHAKEHGLRATGDRNGSRLYPERLPRGKEHYSSLHPESVKRGDKHGMAILTEPQVREIKRLIAAKIRLSVIGRQFAVSYSVIKHIKDGKNWKHVQIEEGEAD